MSESKLKITVGLYIRGDQLDPKSISKILGTVATRSQHKGEKHISFTGKEYTKKIGLWALLSDSDSPFLSDHIDQILERAKKIEAWIEKTQSNLTALPNAQECYLDIFICGNSNQYGASDIEFKISQKQTELLSKFQIPIHFTISAVTEDGMTVKSHLDDS